MIFPYLSTKLGEQPLKVPTPKQAEVGGEVYVPPPLHDLSYFHEFLTDRPKNWTAYRSGPFLSKSGVFLSSGDFFGLPGSYFERR